MDLVRKEGITTLPRLARDRGKERCSPRSQMFGSKNMNAQKYFTQWRSVCRSLWNETYMTIIIEQGGSTELEEEFCRIEQILFDSIVLGQMDTNSEKSEKLDSHMNSNPSVLERFLIVPRGNTMSVMINRELTSGYWDHPITELRKGEAVIGFVHYYDFCGMDMPRRYEYIRGRIMECSKNPEIVGKDILVPADLGWIEDKRATEHASVGDGENHAAPKT
jgi:hypothetical protein